MNEAVAARRLHGWTLESLSKVAEQAIEGVVVIDVDRIVRFANAAWAEMHGRRNAPDLLGEHINKFHSEAQVRTELTPLLEEAGLRGRIAGPIDHVKRDGTTFPTQTKILLLKSPSNEPHGFIILALDRTENKENAVQLKRQSAELDQLSRRNEQLAAQVEQLIAASEQLEQKAEKHNEAREDALLEIGKLKQQGVNVEEQLAEANQLNEQLSRAREERDEAPEHLPHQTPGLKEFRGDLEQRVAEWVDARTIASEILGISRLKFWLLCVRGRIGPKPERVNGSVRWKLSSIVRWIEWDCCDSAEFRAREHAETDETRA